MSDGMGRDRLGPQRGELVTRFVGIPFDQRPDTKARQRLVGAVETHRLIRPTAGDEAGEHGHRRGRPQGTIAHLAAFAEEPHRR